MTFKAMVLSVLLFMKIIEIISLIQLDRSLDKFDKRIRR